VTRSKVRSSKIKCIPQCNDNLGQKLHNMFMYYLNRPICSIGGYIPNITKLEISKAFRKLGSLKFVVGPAEDSGFWLIGHQGQLPRKLFEGVRWSSPWTLSDTIETFEDQPFSSLSKLQDVDSLADLEALK